MTDLMGTAWDYIADGFPPARGRGIAPHSHTCDECRADFECDCPDPDGDPELCGPCEAVRQEGWHPGVTP